MILVAVLVVLLVISAGATLIGFLATSSLAQFRPELSGMRSSYPGQPADVQRSFVTAVNRTHGVRVIDQSGADVLVSTYPTPFHMYGSFGLFVRCRFVSDPDVGSAVIIDAQHKVGWAGRRSGGSYREFELIMRKAMRATGVDAHLDFSDPSSMNRPSSQLRSRAATESAAASTTQADHAEPAEESATPFNGDATVEAGWYPDPQSGASLRYWDGTSWTDHTHDGTEVP